MFSLKKPVFGVKILTSFDPYHPHPMFFTAVGTRKLRPGALRFAPGSSPEVPLTLLLNKKNLFKCHNVGEKMQIVAGVLRVLSLEYASPTRQIAKPGHRLGQTCQE